LRRKWPPVPGEMTTDAPFEVSVESTVRLANVMYSPPVVFEKVIPLPPLVPKLMTVSARADTPAVTRRRNAREKQSFVYFIVSLSVVRFATFRG